MARSSKSRPGSSYSRGTPRGRTAARPAARVTKRPSKKPVEDVESEVMSVDRHELDEAVLPARKRRFNFTGRALILGIVLAALVVTYATSLRVFFNQRHQIGQTKEEIATRKESIVKLEDEIARWEDPEYVKAQARERLGWVLPGETGYKVIGADGKPISGGVEILVDPTENAAEKSDWVEDLWGTVKAADAPIVEEEPEVEEIPSAPKTILPPS